MSMDFYAATFDAERNSFSYISGIEHVNVSNSNGYEIIRELGFEPYEGGLDAVDINLFITRCQSFLRNHLGKPDPARPVVIERSAASVQFDALCSQHGNMMGKLQQMFAVPGVPVVEVTRSSGPTMIDCGRSEGYLQNRIRKILDSIQQGKEQGATHVYVA